MADLRSVEGWQEYIDRYAKRFATMAEQEEQQLAAATLFMNRHPITGTPFKQDSALVVIARFDEEENCKNDHVQVVRAASIAGDAFASFYTSEAWMSESSDGKIAPSQDPKRKEILLLMCEHRTFESCTMTSVIDTVDGQRRCGPWQKTPLFEGGFAHFIAPNPPDAASTNVLRAYLKLLQMRGRVSDLIPMDPDDAIN